MADAYTAAPTRVKGLIQGLGLVDSTTLVMGSMIGSGIFIVAADISRQVQSPGLLILVWLLTAALTVIAALSYGELAAAMPHAGGQYVYLRESLGPLSGFLYGWTLFLVIQTGTIAAVAVGFAKFSGVFFPWISASNHLLEMGRFAFNTQQLVGIAVLVLLTVVNIFGIRTGAFVQNIFTFAKTAALLGLVIMGFALGSNADAARQNFTDFWRGASLSFDTLRIVAVAMVGALFAADAWNNITFTAGEVKNPRRNLPLSLALGTGAVLALYVMTNFVYLRWLPLEAMQRAPEDRVATASIQAMLGGNAERLMAAAIMVSTFGCMNGLILAGARVYYAMARDGLFFRRVADVHPRYHSPVASLWVQCVWASLLTLSGTYNDLLDYVIFAVVLFYILTIVGLFVLRRTRPEMERPYRAVAYPWAPALYIVVATFIEVMLLIYKPGYTWPGLIIVLMGVPVYYLWRRGGGAAQAGQRGA
jgi:APA family basic amino acid/polyamine antiporter